MAEEKTTTVKKESLTSVEYRQAYENVLDFQRGIFEDYVKPPDMREDQLKIYAIEDFGRDFEALSPEEQQSVTAAVDTYAREMEVKLRNADLLLKGEVNAETKKDAQSLMLDAYINTSKWLASDKERLKNDPNNEGIQLGVRNLTESLEEEKKAFFYACAAKPSTS